MSYENIRNIDLVFDDNLILKKRKKRKEKNKRYGSFDDLK